MKKRPVITRCRESFGGDCIKIYRSDGTVVMFFECVRWCPRLNEPIVYPDDEGERGETGTDQL